MKEIKEGTTLWKKALWFEHGWQHEAIVELEVTKPGFIATHERQYFVGKELCSDPNTLKKARVREAVVKSIVDRYTNESVEVAWSLHDTRFEYRVGDTVKPMSAFNESDVACASGIHGFEDRDSAVDYKY